MDDDRKTCKSCYFWDNRNKKPMGICRFHVIPPTRETPELQWPSSLYYELCPHWSVIFPEESESRTFRRTPSYGGR